MENLHSQITQLRQRSAALLEQADQLQTLEAREAFRDLARLYDQMAQSVAELEALQAGAPDPRKNDIPP